MSVNRFHVALASLVMIAPAIRTGQSQPDSIQGAWRIVRTSLVASEQPSFRDYSQPGLILFTARHYSLMYVEGNEPRKLFRDPSRPTDSEKVEAFDTFAGHSGSYSIRDSIIAMRIEIAKAPNLMGPELRDSFAQFAYRLAGDTLQLTRRTPRGAFALQLVRVQ